MVSKSVKGKKKLPVAVRGSRIADETSGPWKPGHKSVTFPLVSRLFAAAIFFGPITREDGTDASRDFSREGRRQGRSCSVFGQVYLVFYFSSTYKIKQVSLFDIFMLS